MLASQDRTGANTPAQLQEDMTARLAWPHFPGSCYDWQKNQCCRNSFWWSKSYMLHFLKALWIACWCTILRITSYGRSSQNLHSFQPLSSQRVFIRNWQSAAWEHTKVIQSKERFKGFFPLFYGNNRILMMCLMPFPFFLFIWFISFVCFSSRLLTKLCEWCKIITNTKCLKTFS